MKEEIIFEEGDIIKHKIIGGDFVIVADNYFVGRGLTTIKTPRWKVRDINGNLFDFYEVEIKQ
jgi:hypothetical protein